MLLGLCMCLGFTARFLLEFIKNPQVGFEEQMSLVMGQWLSIPFLLFGIGLLIYSFVKGKPALLPPKKK
jgi:prolipoprotein diacylglyceryltransferase